MDIKQYERKVIELLCSGALDNSVLYKALNHPQRIEVHFTGAGYYLEISHSDLAESRIVCDSPLVLAVYQEIEISFIVFIENGVLCLECYSYGTQVIPEEIRCGSVQIVST